MKTAYDNPPRLSRQFLRDRKWVSEHMEELIEKYPNQCVLVQKGKVIAHGDEAFATWAKADKFGLSQPYLRFIERGVHVY